MANGGDAKIAYFSMEVGIDPDMPTYSGGLGVLAGDTLRSCADMKVPVVGITLVSNRGYFRQTLDHLGNQTESPVEWDIASKMQLIPLQVTVPIRGRQVKAQVWRYVIAGITGHEVPVYFLDTDIPENDEKDRSITHQLYGGDAGYRFSQEVVLGIGGIRILESLGYDSIIKYHMNEGHAALLVVELLKRENRYGSIAKVENGMLDEVRRRCVFTTHTPVSAGHDQFHISLVRKYLQGYLNEEELWRVCGTDMLNMTMLAINHSQYVNGVARKHGETSRNMFPGYEIDSITNGVHPVFWAAEPIRALYDRFIDGWRRDPYRLREAYLIPDQELVAAHAECKRQLIAHLRERCRPEQAALREDVFTIGFARRATRYKRPALLIYDIERLRRIVGRVGPLQVVYGGKAHPHDWEGKESIKNIFRSMQDLLPAVTLVYLPDYDMRTGRLLTSGVDLWLNTPLMPLEASGTSGMKAALNGVPSLSVLDGWWLEGHIENVTGWSIGSRDATARPEGMADGEDAYQLYDKLEQVIMPRYYNTPDKWVRVMKTCVVYNASFFNSHRMVQQYVLNAYFS